MKINLLVSTMGKKDYRFLEKINIQSPVVVVNQMSGIEKTEEIEQDGYPVRIISNHEKGLSKSRNLALKNAKADISVITDDDMIYDFDYPEKILQAYEDVPDADVIAFQVERFGNPEKTKSFSNKLKKLNFLTSMKVSSVEITFRTEKIREKGITFNENIGAGTDYPNGEENQFLYECLRAGLNLYYVPVKIGKVDMSESTWYQGYNVKYLKAIGVKFYNMSPKYYRLLIWQYLIRKHEEYADKYSFIQAKKFMFQGVSEYKALYEEDASV